jgi:hypothetical protein
MIREEGGDLYTFSTSSKGGLNAIAELCIEYDGGLRKHPGQDPVIALRVSSYQHKNREYGRIKNPVLEIVGWTPKQND